MGNYQATLTAEVKPPRRSNKEDASMNDGKKRNTLADHAAAAADRVRRSQKRKLSTTAAAAAVETNDAGEENKKKPKKSTENSGKSPRTRTDKLTTAELIELLFCRYKDPFTLNIAQLMADLINEDAKSVSEGCKETKKKA